MKTTKIIEFGKLSILSTLAVVFIGITNNAMAANSVENSVPPVDIKFKQTFTCFDDNLEIKIYENSNTLQSVATVEEVNFVQNFMQTGPVLPKSIGNFQFLVGTYQEIENTPLFEKIVYSYGASKDVTVVKTVTPGFTGVGNTRLCGRGSCHDLPKTTINAELNLNGKVTSLICNEPSL